MILSDLLYYLLRLVKSGHYWQYTNINGQGVKPKHWFSNIQLFIIALSLLCTLLNPLGFNKDFIGYIITALSIFVGLFLSLIVVIYDKFRNTDFDIERCSNKQKLYLQQIWNFFSQFTGLTSYAILISILSIILLSISLISAVNVDIDEYYFLSYKEWSLEAIILFLNLSMVFLYRMVTIYFIVDFLLLCTYAVSSIYSFIYLEYEKRKPEIRLNEALIDHDKVSIKNILILLVKKMSTQSIFIKIGASIIFLYLFVFIIIQILGFIKSFFI